MAVFPPYSIFELPMVQAKPDQYKNNLKGELAQVLYRSILEKAGYKVKSLGIETIVPAVRERPGKFQAPYPCLRVLPDFSVYDPESEELWLMEVKYRSDLSLKDVLRDIDREQIQFYSPLLLAVASKKCLKEGPGDASGHLGLFKLQRDPKNDEVILVNETPWTKGQDLSWDLALPLHAVFPKISSEAGQPHDAALQVVGDLFQLN